MTVVKKIIRSLAVVLSLAMFAALLLWMLFSMGGQTANSGRGLSAAIMDKLDMFVNNSKAAALDGIVPIEKVYRLDESLVVAPEPDPELFGSGTDPKALDAVIASAGELLEGQSTVFGGDISIQPGSEINWYCDETILCITWKEVINNASWTFSEVKIADPSQFRRYLAENTFGSAIQYTTSDMAATVNAVAAINGDFYKFRDLGVVVYKGDVYRSKGQFVDSCCIDKNGDMKFIHKGEILDDNAAQSFVDENDILFSVAFGPILIEDGVNVAPGSYIIGEITDIYARAALCQVDRLHYLLVTVNTDGMYTNAATIAQLAAELEKRGVQQAYTLDGGQTATIVMNDQVINAVEYGSQRNISDIMYFATALPERK